MNSNEPQKPQLNIGDVSSSAFLMPIRWFEKMFCKHKKRTELHRCYQERYVSEVCDNCRTVIYSDI